MSAKDARRRMAQPVFLTSEGPVFISDVGINVVAHIIALLGRSRDPEVRAISPQAVATVVVLAWVQASEMDIATLFRADTDPSVVRRME